MGLGCDLADGNPAPRVRKGAAVGAVYVDNALVIGATKEETSLVFNEVLAKLDEIGLEYHAIEHPTQVIDFVGLTLDLQERRLRNTRKRAWRLYLSLARLLQIKGATS